MYADYLALALEVDQIQVNQERYYSETMHLREVHNTVVELWSSEADPESRAYLERSIPGARARAVTSWEKVERLQFRPLMSNALQIFAMLARADAQSPHAKSWRRASKDLSEHVTTVGAQITSTQAEMFSQPEKMQTFLLRPSDFGSEGAGLPDAATTDVETPEGENDHGSA